MKGPFTIISSAICLENWLNTKFTKMSGDG